MSETKTCAWCGTVFERKPTYSNYSWAKVRCCSLSCGSRLRSQDPAYLAKIGELRRAYNIAHPEENAARLARSAATKGANYPASDPKKRGRSQALRRFKLRPCDDCGIRKSDRLMHRHHIDLNPMNNQPSNVAILCSACHGIRHRGDETRTTRKPAA